MAEYTDRIMPKVCCWLLKASGCNLLRDIKAIIGVYIRQISVLKSLKMYPVQLLHPRKRTVTKSVIKSPILQWHLYLWWVDINFWPLPYFWGFFRAFHHIHLGIFVLHIFPHAAFNELKILNVIFKKVKCYICIRKQLFSCMSDCDCAALHRYSYPTADVI